MEMTLAQRLVLWLPPFALMALIFVLSAQPDLSSGLGTADLVGRKIIHFLEYALLALLWWRALRTRIPARRAALVAFVLASLYAATDEWHQSFVHGRHATPVDWAIDSAGAGTAAWRLRSRSLALGGLRS
jgi:VanZ family protein